MKTRKVLALVVLAAMVLSLMPAMAFGANDVDLYNSVVIAPEGSVPALNTPAGDKDGNEFSLILVGDGAVPSGNLYISSSRMTADTLFYKKGPNWLAVPGDGTGNGWVINLSLSDGETPPGYYYTPRVNTTIEVNLKLQSNAAGTSRLVFSVQNFDAVTPVKGLNQYAINASTDGVTVADILTSSSGVYRHNATFTAAIPTNLNLTVTDFAFKGYDITVAADKAVIDADPDSFRISQFDGLYYIASDRGVRTIAGGNKPANGVDSYTLVASVVTGSIPVSGVEVTFSITGGSGGNLTTSRATTNAAGRAETRVYSTRADSIEVLARIVGLAEQSATYGDPPKNKVRTDKATVVFASTGVASIKAESNNDQKVARDPGDWKDFAISVYDVNGNRLDMLKLFGKAGTPGPVYDSYYVISNGKGKSTNESIINFTTTVVSKPSGANLIADNVEYGVSASGNLIMWVPMDKLNKDGDYTVRIHLVNGVSVSYAFNVRDQGDVTKIIASYGSSSYAAGTVLGGPLVIYEDADGYGLSKPYGAWLGNGKALSLSISDASFMDGQMVDGDFLLKSDKYGTITMTLVDRDRNLVDSVVLEITKAASYLKLTPASVGAVGGEVQVNIELVDIDGKRATTGLGVQGSNASAAVISKPEGALSTISSVFVSDFWLFGTANVRVSSNMEGDVGIRVILKEDESALPGVDVVTTVADLKPNEKYGGRTYTGAATVSFGSTSGVGGTLIFIIGAPSFVSGNKALTAESPAFIEGGRTFLGVRDIGTAIGATVDWDQDTQTATLAKNDIVVKVTVGAEVIVVTKGGVTTEIANDAPAQNKAGRVYLPFRALLEAFGYTVSWDEGTQSITCNI